jgi:hypothetical protein
MTAADTPTILRRVQALLAKADSTEFEEEAETLRVKANELITRHSISAAMLAAEGRQADALAKIEIKISGAYSHNQATLLHYIAQIFNCSTVAHPVKAGSRTIGKCTVVGYHSDLDIVEGLFQIINTQAVHGCARAVVPYYEHGRAYRNSWWFGFNRVVFARLKQAHTTAVQEASASSSGASAELVLVDRAAKVEAYRKELFAHTRTTHRQSRSNIGYGAGKQAGARADIGQSRVGGSRTAIR